MSEASVFRQLQGFVDGKPLAKHTKRRRGEDANHADDDVAAGTATTITDPAASDSQWGTLARTVVLKKPKKKKKAKKKGGKVRWRRILDSSSGNYYYYDPVANVTQWDEPEEIRRLVRWLVGGLVGGRSNGCNQPTGRFIGRSASLIMSCASRLFSLFIVASVSRVHPVCID